MSNNRQKFSPYLQILALWAGLSCCIITPNSTQAQEAEPFVLEGLSFACPSCRIREDELCEISLGDNGLPMLLRCEEALQKLLSSLNSAGANAWDHQFPSANEIRRFLLSKLRTPELAQPALRLLVQDEAGREFLKADTGQFLDWYPDVLKQLIIDEIAPIDVWMAIWDLPGISDAGKNAGMRAVIAAKQPDIPLSKLFDSLSSVDPETDLAALMEYQTALQELQPAWHKQIVTTANLVDLCREFNKALPEECWPKSLRKLPNGAADYLQRLVLHLALERVVSGELSDYEAIALLSQTNYRDFRTPRTHELLLQHLIRAARAEVSKEDRFPLTPEISAMLSEFSKEDREVAYWSAVWFTQLAGLAARRAEFENAVELIEHSLSYSRDEITDRDALLVSLEKNQALKNNPQLLARLLQAVRPQTKQESAANNANKRTAFFFLLLSVIGVILFFFGVAQRSRRLKQQEQQVLSQVRGGSQRAELRELLQYFDLPPTATEEELTRNYRLKVKELHPDTGSGDAKQFERLQKNYQRVKQLLAVHRRA